MALVGLALIALAWWGIAGLRRDLIVRDLVGDGGVPLTYLAPASGRELPGVIIAHGFSGSRQLMLGFANALARGGYGVMLLDFDGHGTNPRPPDRTGDAMQRNIDAAYDALIAQPEVDARRISLLGHSMGSGVVMRAGIEQGERYRATIAVSPTGADVSPERPANLLLLAGGLEPQFADNARRLLSAAGGENGDIAGGRGRQFVLVPRVEHITILFSGVSQQAALDWLNRTYDLPLTPVAPDRRLLWYGLHLGGWLILLIAVAPLLSGTKPAPAGNRRPPWHWAGLLLGVAIAAALTALLGRLTEIGRLGGLLVGGALAVWFLAMGGVWLLLGYRPPTPDRRDLLGGLGLFVALSLAFGVMAQFVWLPWLLIPSRLVMWPFVAAAVFPWLLAAGLSQHNQSAARRAGWWLLQTVVIVAGLALTVVLSPGLFFVILLIPVIPLVLGIMAVAGAAFSGPWRFALGNALFFGWILVAVFPRA